MFYRNDSKNKILPSDQIPDIVYFLLLTDCLTGGVCTLLGHVTLSFARKFSLPAAPELSSSPATTRISRLACLALPSLLPGWPDSSRSSRGVLSSCPTVPLTHVWTAASTARHRQFHYTQLSSNSKATKYSQIIFFFVKIANKIFKFNLVNVL